MPLMLGWCGRGKERRSSVFDFGLHLIMPDPQLVLVFRCGCVLAPERIDRCALHDEFPIRFELLTRAA